MILLTHSFEVMFLQ